jgi:hypothetical protein
MELWSKRLFSLPDGCDQNIEFGSSGVDQQSENLLARELC